MAASCSANWCGSAGAIITGSFHLDQQNAAETMSWQRPVLLLPADSVVAAIFFDLRTRPAPVMSAAPARSSNDLGREVLDVIPGAHEVEWRRAAKGVFIARDKLRTTTASFEVDFCALMRSGSRHPSKTS
jgi:hypothetical protein